MSYLLNPCHPRTIFKNQGLKFLKYFYYLASNWNISIAWHIIRNEMRGEKKYGIDTTGADELQGLEEKGIDISHATVYMPVSYDLLEVFFAHVDVRQFNHFLDIGCGKARAMCVAAHFGAKKISGTDLSRELFLVAKENLAATKKQRAFEYEVFNQDAFYYEIDDDVDCIFMFNPFDDVIMSGVLENIEVSLENNPRKMTVIYINPLQKHLFLQSGYKEVYHFQEMHYLEGSIFIK